MAEWLRALDFSSFTPGSNPNLVTSWSCFGSPKFDSSIILAHSQLVCLRPLGSLTCYVQFIVSFKIFVSFARPHKPMANTYRVKLSYLFLLFYLSTTLSNNNNRGKHYGNGNDNDADDKDNSNNDNL